MILFTFGTMGIACNKNLASSVFLQRLIYVAVLQIALLMCNILFQAVKMLVLNQVLL